MLAAHAGGECLLHLQGGMLAAPAGEDAHLSNPASKTMVLNPDPHIPVPPGNHCIYTSSKPVSKLL